MRTALIIAMKLAEGAGVVFVPWGISRLVCEKVMKMKKMKGVQGAALDWVLGIPITISVVSVVVLIIHAFPRWLVLNGQWADKLLGR